MLWTYMGNRLQVELRDVAAPLYNCNCNSNAATTTTATTATGAWAVTQAM